MNKIIEQTYTINAPKDIVWEALTDPKHIENWSHDKAIMDDQVGTSFKLWNGDVYGKNLEVTDGEELVQEWFGGKWDEPSKVTFTLMQKGDKTTIHLSQEGVPEEDYEEIEDGWNEYYFGPMKEYIEDELV